jgi:hypothetical protein
MNSTHKGKHMTATAARGRFDALTDEARVRIKRAGGELLDDAQVRGERALKQSRGWIAKNPGTAVACAFLGGVLLYAWAGRKSDD